MAQTFAQSHHPFIQVTWLTVGCFVCSSNLLLQQFWWVSLPPPPGKGGAQGPVLPSKVRAVRERPCEPLNSQHSHSLLSHTFSTSWVTHSYWAQIYRLMEISQVSPWVLKIIEAQSVAKNGRVSTPSTCEDCSCPLDPHSHSQQTLLCLKAEFFWPQVGLFVGLGLHAPVCSGLRRLCYKLGGLQNVLTAQL